MLVGVLGALLGSDDDPIAPGADRPAARRAQVPRGHRLRRGAQAGASAESREMASEEARAEERAAAAAGLKSGTSGRTIFTGFGIGLLYKTPMVALKGWKDVPERIFRKPFTAGSISAEISPSFWCRYIIGPRSPRSCGGGGVMAYRLLIPDQVLRGRHSPAPSRPGTSPSARMSPNDSRGPHPLHRRRARSRAAGSSARALAADHLERHQGRAARRGQGRQGRRRRPPHRARPVHEFVFIGILVADHRDRAGAPSHMNLLGAILIVVFGFLFVTVSSRLTGEIGYPPTRFRE